MSVNKCILVGRLGKEPESRAFQDGTAVCNFSEATSESWKDKQTGERKEKTEWHNIQTTRKLAEICQQYLHKGSQVYIEGRIQTRKWQDQGGQDRYTTEIVANQMRMLDSKGDSGQGGYQQSAPAPQAAPQPASPSAGPDYGSPQGGAGYLDDEIPF